MLLLEGGRLVCPLSDLDAPGHSLLLDPNTGQIVAHLPPGASRPPGVTQVVDCAGCIVAPGLVDLCSDFADPGEPWREDLQSGSAAAAAGGFTTVVLSPNTAPPLDEPSAVAAVVQRAGAQRQARVRVAGALTRGLLGAELSELGMLAEAGCVAYSDGGVVIADALVLRRAMQYAAPSRLPVLLRPGEPALEERGVMSEGAVSMRIGLHGIPAAAEEIGVARAVALARLTGAQVHLTQVTTARALWLVEQAIDDGVQISAAVPARSLLLTDAWLEENLYDTAGRLLPPLRDAADRDALVAGVRRGSVVVGADHVPFSRVEKELEFNDARPGAVGLETAAAAAWTVLREARVWVEALSVRPAAVLGQRVCLAVGAAADVVVLDPDASVAVAGPVYSRGVNEPLRGQVLSGAVRATIVAGRLVFGSVAGVP